MPRLLLTWICASLAALRLQVWAVDQRGEPVGNVTYVVSEYFVVATKRVKHAIKSVSGKLGAVPSTATL